MAQQKTLDLQSARQEPRYQLTLTQFQNGILQLCFQCSVATGVCTLLGCVTVSISLQHAPVAKAAMESAAQPHSSEAALMPGSQSSARERPELSVDSIGTVQERAKDQSRGRPAMLPAQGH